MVTVTAALVNDHVFEVAANYVNISGFKVTGATGMTSHYAGIYLGSVNYANISNNNASNNHHGIRLYSSSNNTLMNNTANSNTDNGIWLLSSRNNTLTNNTVNLNLHGFDVQASSNYNTLSGNNVSSNTQYGIYLYLSSNNTIYNNYFNNTHNAYDNRNNTWNTAKTEGRNIINGSYFGGNYWSNYAGADTIGSDGLGDTLTPYNSSGNILNGGDYKPLVTIGITDTTAPVITISVPVNNANLSIFDRIISGSITDDSVITANMYVNSVFTNTWGSKGNFRWPYNFTNGANSINISATDAYNNINWTNISVFVLSPVNDASVNLTVNQSVNITANASAGVDVVLSTGNNAANVTVKINASINASYFNVSDIDTEFVIIGIARKSLVKFVEINATGDVVNLSSVKITMFYNDSDLDLNGNGIIDAGDIKEDTLNLYWHWGNDTSGNQEWFPLTLGADYSGKLDRNNNSGPIVISVERNTAFKYISVSTDHFSLYSIAGAPIPATTTTTTGSGGGGSGGNGVVTEEPPENIARFEMIEKNLEAGKPVTYTFTRNQDVVYEVSVTGKENEYDISMRIEILKNRSKQAKENAPGLVYRNANIISGTKNIGENVIKFKVNDSWLQENGFDCSDIRLVKWVDDKWIILETGVLFNKDGYTHFSAKSMTFSTYAITGIKKEKMMPVPSAIEKTAVTPEAAPLSKEEPTPQPEGKTPIWIWMIIAGLLITALFYSLRRR